MNTRELCCRYCGRHLRMGEHCERPACAEIREARQDEDERTFEERLREGFALLRGHDTE